MEQKIQIQAQRNTGVDAMRVLTTMMVLVVHVLNLGKVLHNCSQTSLSFYVGLVLLVMCFCAINCYGLISGYVGVYSRIRYSRLALLWLQVMFYNVLSLLLFKVAKVGWPGVGTVLDAFTPTLHISFWYFTAYAAVFMLLPVLNKGLQALTPRQARFLCWVIVVVFSVLPELVAYDSFNTWDGYSPIWLILVYILGGCMRRGEVFAKTRTIWLVLGYALGVAVTTATRLLLGDGYIQIFSIIYYTGNMFFATSSPAMLLCGMFVMALFARIKITNRAVQKVIGFLAPTTFGVYLIHAQHDMRTWIFSLPIFRWIASLPMPAMIGMVFVASVGLFLACAIIEKLRQLLFELLRLRKGLEKLEAKLLGNLWDE